MAHSCPECDMVCHCGGDIDDIILDGTKKQEKCTHWKECQESEYDPEDDLYGEELEEEERAFNREAGYE